MNSVAKEQKTQRGDPLGTIKNFRKKPHSAEKNQKGDPLASAGFVGYVKKVKNERGDPLETKKIFEKKVAQCRKKRKKIEWGTL